MKTIRARDGGDNWHDVNAYSSTDVPLVITKAINEEGYWITHVQSGGGVVFRRRVAELRPLLAKLLASDIDWAQPFDTLSSREKMSGAVKAAVGGPLHPRLEWMR